MRCLVLPGMDGTGALLDDFIAAMAPRFDTQVIAYPRDRALDYAELAAFVHPRLPTDRPYLLLGESFSGPVAIALAAQRPPNLAGLALCASFARSPRPPWSPWSAARLPRWATTLPVSRIPVALIAQMMLGRWSDARWRARIAATLNAVRPAVLAHRLARCARSICRCCTCARPATAWSAPTVCRRSSMRGRACDTSRSTRRISSCKPAPARPRPR